ncbi:MAG: ABC transporter substrate-binding protein [Lachnospiraceae bacterium]|nr:ABC transporter substrate-binding protein [Lachnospiraceae bacterium]
MSRRIKGIAYAAVTTVLLSAALGGCGLAGTGSGGREAQTSKEDALTIGFAQVGEESDWRRANSRSIEDAFSAENGYNLLFEDAQNVPENQIKAVRNFIQLQVDYIVLEPILETGWDTVLEEVHEAGIPLIVADRSLDPSYEEYYDAWVGADYLLEGRKVCSWLQKYAEQAGLEPGELKLVNIQGTIGSSAQIGRYAALEEAAEANGWTLLAQARGDFTQAKGREAMQELLETYPELNVVYCDNDNEAYGAIDAIEAAGRVCGRDIRNGEIMILSFDAAAQGLTEVLNGRIACIGECNPHHGPRVREIITKLEAGETFEKIQRVEEGIFAADQTVKTVTAEEQEYPVTVVTEELIEARGY